jgi:chromosome segregation ATPase
MTDNIQQLDSDDGLNVVQIDGTVIEPMLPAFDKINTNFETVLADTNADATTKADAAESAAKAYADGIVATESSTRESADLTLQSNIDAEQTRATGIEQGLRTDVDSVQAQVTANDSDITALQTIQSGDVSGLQSQLDAEVTRATGIESGLRTDVDAVTGRVDTIIGTSPETLDTIQEIVTAFEDADDNLQQVITNNSGRLTTAETDIGAIEVRTTDLETTVTQNQSKVGTGSFNTTAQNNVDAVNELHGELDASVSRIDGHDTIVGDLQAQITSEVNRATSQETTILSELAASSGVLDNQNSSGNPVKLWTGTQSQYSALTPDPDTLYFITG